MLPRLNTYLSRLEVWNCVNIYSFTASRPGRAQSTRATPAARKQGVRVMATANPAIGAADQSPAASRENFKGEVLDPSVFNKNWVRLGAVALVVGLAARGTGYLPARWAAFTHLLSFSINLGMIFWVSTMAPLLPFCLEIYIHSSLGRGPKRSCGGFVAIICCRF